jgi:hypothetical protein
MGPYKPFRAFRSTQASSCERRRTCRHTGLHFQQCARGFLEDFESARDCFMLLTAGLIASSLASGAAYFSQLFYTAELNSYTPVWEHPWVASPYTWRLYIGHFFRTVTVVLVVLGYTLFFLGAWKFCRHTQVI